jgi:MoaA/NifB/PqqE/SkfB family radical SAM enzyme
MLKTKLLYRIHGVLGSERNRIRAVRAARVLTGRYLLVRMDTNFLCNLRCKTCFFSNPDTADKFQKPMLLEDFRKVAANVFPRARMLTLSCSAEPLITPNFDQFLDVTGQYKVPVTGFVTNGILMKETVMESAVRNRIDEITISIDGATKKTYESIRQGGKWEKLLAGLDVMNQVKARLGAERPELRFNFTACQSNMEEIPALIDLAKKMNISAVRVRAIADWGGTLDVEKETLSKTPDRYNEVLAEAMARAGEAKIDLFAPRPFGDETQSTEDGPVLNRLRKPYACAAPWYFVYIGPAGDYWPCFHLREKGESDGNLIRQTWGEVTKGARAGKRRHLLAKCPSESCLNVCQGDLDQDTNRIDWKGTTLAK